MWSSKGINRQTILKIHICLFPHTIEILKEVEIKTYNMFFRLLGLTNNKIFASSRHTYFGNNWNCSYAANRNYNWITVFINSLRNFKLTVAAANNAPHVGALNVKKASKLKASWMNACYLRMFNYNWLNILCKCMTSLMACTISREFSELKLIHFNEETENIYKQKKLSVWTKKNRKNVYFKKKK